MGKYGIRTHVMLSSCVPNNVFICFSLILYMSIEFWLFIEDGFLSCQCHTSINQVHGHEIDQMYEHRADVAFVARQLTFFHSMAFQFGMITIRNCKKMKQIHVLGSVSNLSKIRNTSFLASLHLFYLKASHFFFDETYVLKKNCGNKNKY